MNVNFTVMFKLQLSSEVFFNAIVLNIEVFKLKKHAIMLKVSTS